MNIFVLKLAKNERCVERVERVVRVDLITESQFEKHSTVSGVCCALRQVGVQNNSFEIT